MRLLCLRLELSLRTFPKLNKCLVAVADAFGELVVQLGTQSLLDVFHGDAHVDVLARKTVVGVVGGYLQRELLFDIDLHPNELFAEACEWQRALKIDDVHRALVVQDVLFVDVAFGVHGCHVAGCHFSLHRLPGRCLVLELAQSAIHVFAGDFDGGIVEPDVFVGAQVHFWNQRDRGFDGDGIEHDNLDGRRAGGLDLLLIDGALRHYWQHVVERLVDEAFSSDKTLHDGPWSLAFAKARDRQLLCQLAV